MTLLKPLLTLLGNCSTAGNAAFRAEYSTAMRELFGSVFDADTSPVRDHKEKLEQNGVDVTAAIVVKGGS